MIADLLLAVKRKNYANLALLPETDKVIEDVTKQRKKDPLLIHARTTKAATAHLLVTTGASALGYTKSK